MEVGRGDGDVPAAEAKRAGEVEVARTAAVGWADGEVVDPQETEHIGGGRVTELAVG